MSRRLFRTPWRRTAALLSSLTALIAALPVAANTVWRGAPLGDWFDAAQWSGGVPDVFRAALIDGGFAQLGPGGDIFGGGAGLLTVGGGRTGRAAGVGVTGSALEAREGLVLGRDNGSVGFVTVGTGGHVQTSYLAPMTIGEGGTGQLSISGGEGLATGSLTLGRYVGSDGTLSVANGDFVVGNAVVVELAPGGRGTVSLGTDGSLWMQSSGLVIGRDGGQGTVSIVGSGALLQAGSVESHAAQLQVSAGGRLEAGPIVDEGSTWALASGGRLQAASMSLDAGSRLQFSLGAGGTGLLSGGRLSLGGTLAVLLDEAVATPGQRVDLMDWSTLQGRFDQLLLPALPSGLAWDTAALYVDGTLAVAAVPEPPAALLLLAGGLLLARRRAR